MAQGGNGAAIVSSGRESGSETIAICEDEREHAVIPGSARGTRGSVKSPGSRCARFTAPGRSTCKGPPRGCLSQPAILLPRRRSLAQAQAQAHLPIHGPLRPALPCWPSFNAPRPPSCSPSHRPDRIYQDLRSASALPMLLVSISVPTQPTLPLVRPRTRPSRPPTHRPAPTQDASPP